MCGDGSNSNNHRRRHHPKKVDTYTQIGTFCVRVQMREQTQIPTHSLSFNVVHHFAFYRKHIWAKPNPNNIRTNTNAHRKEICQDFYAFA